MLVKDRLRASRYGIKVTRPILRDMNLLAIGSVAALAATGAIVGVATGSTHHSQRTQTVTVTKTRTVYVRSTTHAPPVAALVSSHGEAAGRYVAKPSSMRLIPDPSTRATRLHWVDWGQPVTFATGLILGRKANGAVEALPGGIVLYALIACGSKPTYYYKQAYGFGNAAYSGPGYINYGGFAVAGPTPPLASPC